MKTITLKEVCEVFGDGDWIESKDQSDSGIRLIQTGNVGVGVFKDRLEKARWISEETFKKLRCTEILEGDVLISRLPDPVGRSCLIPALEHKAITAVDCSIVRFDPKKIYAKFFIYYSRSSEYAKAIGPLISGSTRQRISRENLGTIKIPLPSLDEQREIVEKLDSIFAEIDALESNLGLGDEKANQLLQSLLSSAFSSTAEDNGTSSNSEDEIISTNLVPLGTVAEVIAGQSPEGIYYNSIGNGTPFYQGKKEFGEKFLGEATTWTTKITKLAEPGDILMSVRAPVGPINFSTQQICIGRGLAAIRAEKLVDKNYLFYFLLHKQPEISGNTGAVFNSINKDQISSIEIPVPSLEKQIEIINKLDIAFAEIESLKLQIKSEKDYVDTLRQSLLNNAFSQKEVVA